MRRWRDAAMESTRLVSNRPELWLAGALSWVATVGWIPLLVALAPGPSVAELTFFGARMVTSGSWPWNAVLIGLAVLVVVALAFVVTSVANAVLIGLLGRRPASGGDIGRLLAVNVLSALPAVLATATVLAVLAMVAPREFNAPQPAGGPVLRTIVNLTPYLALFVLTAVGGGALAAAASRVVIRQGIGVVRALRSATALAIRSASIAHAVLAFLTQLAFIAVAALLLSVLWAPIGVELSGGGGMQLATGLLLIGFVAIWLCLVLAGGALHAWSAATWSRLLTADPAGRT